MDVVLIPKGSSNLLRYLTCPSESFTSPWVGCTKKLFKSIVFPGRMRRSTCCHRTRVFLCVGPTDSTQDRISSCPRSNLWPTYPSCSPWCFDVQIGHKHVLMTREILYSRFQCPTKYHSWLRTCGTLTHTLSTRGSRRVTQRFPTRIIRGSPFSFVFVTLSRIRFSFLFFILQYGWKKIFQENKKVVKFS